MYGVSAATLNVKKRYHHSSDHRMSVYHWGSGAPPTTTTQVREQKVRKSRVCAPPGTHTCAPVHSASATGCSTNE